MAASLAAQPRVMSEVEKTLVYAPEEVCAYQYLAECCLENRFPGRAESWYEKGLMREPLLANIDLLYKIKVKKADSLLLAHDARTAVQELTDFIKRMEQFGTRQYWQHSELYLKLGTVYVNVNDTAGAVNTWRRGLAFIHEGSYYYDGSAMMMAESLKTYNPAFNNDSVSALWPEAAPPYDDNFIWSTAQVLYNICFNFVSWFFAGLIISIVIFAITFQRGTEQVRELLLHIKPGRIFVDFLLFTLVPALALPILVTSIPGLSNLAVLVGAISKMAGILGIVLALPVLWFEARTKKFSYAAMLFFRFIPLWLLNAVLLAMLFSVLVILYSLLLPFLGYAQ